MATTQAFLKETVLQNKFIRPGIVKVVMHEDVSLENGSVVKEVADSVVYMKAIFTPQSLDTYYTSFEDSFNSPPDWNHALLLLNQFHVEFQHASAPDNAEKKHRFVLIIERFGLYNLHEGFYCKNQLTDIMADPEVLAKAEEMEKDVFVRQSEDEQSQDCSDVPTSLLLEQLGQFSIDDESGVTSQCEEEEGNDLVEQPREDSSVVQSLQSALEKMRCVNCEEFLVSPEEQAVLDAIPEWKDDYIPPASDSSEEQQSKASMGTLLDVLFENPTLQNDVYRALDHRPSAVTQHAASGEAGQSDGDFSQEEERTVGDGPSAQKDINPEGIQLDVSLCAGHEGSQAGAVEEDIDVVQDNTGTEEGQRSTEDIDPNAIAASQQCESSDNHQQEPGRDPSATAASQQCESKDNHQQEPGRDPSATAASQQCESKDNHQQEPGRDPSATAASQQCESKDNHQQEPGSSESSKSSEDFSASHPDVTFTLSSMSHVENINCSAEDVPASLCVSAASLPAVFSGSTPAEEDMGDQQDQNVLPGQIGLNLISEKDGEAVINTYILASDPASVDHEHLDADARKWVATSVGGSPKKAEVVGRVVRIIEASGETADSSALERDEQQQPGSSDDVRVSFFGLNTSDDPVEQLVVTSGKDGFASQGFVPSDITSQDWLSCGSHLSEVQHSDAAKVGDSMQASQSFVPSGIQTQDLIPNDSEFESTHRAKEDGSGNEHVSALTPACARGETFQERSSCSPHWHTAGDVGSKVRAVLEKSHTTEASLSQAGGENSQFEEDQPVTQNEEVNVCLDSLENPSEHGIHHSTQNTSADSGQSPSVLEISAIQPSDYPQNKHSVPGVKPSSAEYQKQTDNRKTQTRPEKNNNRRGIPVSQRKRQETSGSPPAKMTKHSDIIHPEMAHSCKVLVDCSGSSDSEDSFDRELMQQVTRQGSAQNPPSAHQDNSGEVIVIPESSQEDVVLISSSSGSSVIEIGSQSLEAEACTVGELLHQMEKRPDDNRIRRACLDGVDSASTSTTRALHAANCSVSASKESNHQNPAKQSSVTRNKEFSHNRGTHTNTQKTNTMNGKVMNGNAYGQKKDSSDKSKDNKDKRSGQTEGHDRSPVSMTGSDEHDMARPTVVENSSLCDEGSASEGEVQRVMSPHRKRLSPWGSSHQQPTKRPRRKECEQACSDSSLGRYAIPGRSGVDSLEPFRLNRRKDAHPKTLPARDNSSEHAMYRQTDTDISGRLHPSRTETSTAEVCTGSRKTSGSVISTHTQVHVQPGIRANVSASPSVSKTGHHRQVFVLETDSSTDESENAFPTGFSRNRVIAHRHAASHAVRNKSNNNRSSYLQSRSVHASPHCSTSSDSSPSEAGRIRNNLRQSKGSERNDCFGRDRQTTASSKHSHNKAKTHSPSPHKTGPLVKTTSRSKSKNHHAIFTRLQQLDPSETEEETASETDSSREDLADQMRTNFRAWLEYTARLEDPKQKRLRQLKLTEVMLKKVEECLSTPST